MTTDCGACLNSSSTAFYCYNSYSYQEYCCNDKSIAACQSSSTITCSPTRASGGELAYTYCKGASSPAGCNQTSLSLTASGSWQTVQVNNFPAYVTVSNTKSYKACYYTIAPADYKFKEGATIKLFLSSA